MVRPGQVVGLNGGTTTTEVARALATRADLSSGAAAPAVTVVTNALNIATELAVRQHIKIVTTGGVARPQSYELTGPLATGVLEQVTLDVAILGVDGIDAVAGATAHHEGEASINRLMARQARQVIIVADSSKVGRRAFARICAPGRDRRPGHRHRHRRRGRDRAQGRRGRRCHRLTSAGDLVVIGDCNPDVLVLGDDVTPAFGQQEKLVDGISLVIGGSAAITAVAAARLGLRVALVAAVGADPAGAFMLDQLAREGVDVSAVAVRDGHADRHDGGAVPRRRPGHPDRPRRDGLADRGGRTGRAARAGPGTCTSAPTSCSRTRSGPGLAGAPGGGPGRRRHHLARHQLGPVGALGATSACPPRSRRPTCCCRTRPRRCG